MHFWNILFLEFKDLEFDLKVFMISSLKRRDATRSKIKKAPPKIW